MYRKAKVFKERNVVKTDRDFNFIIMAFSSLSLFGNRK